MTRWYRLNEHEQPIAVPETELFDANGEYFKWLQANKRVAETTLETGEWVSTVFLGLDHSFYGDGQDPILWETMVFANKDDRNEIYQRRYNNAADARRGHIMICERLVDPFRRKELLNETT